ncbi:MAG: peptide protein [Rhodospirillales bacterium]|nr:peptide protein [Rhodospirillales bacterium]
MRAFLIGFVFVLASNFPAHAETPVGMWLTESGRAAVEVSDCGGGLLCGKIAWLKEAMDETGKPRLDKNNPAAELKSQKLCGLLMVGNFKPTSKPNEWDGGFIYNPEDGKTYSSEMELKSPDVLGVRGYVGIPLFGKSQTWTRLPNDHPRCKP